MRLKRPNQHLYLQLLDLGSSRRYIHSIPYILASICWGSVTAGGQATRAESAGVSVSTYLARPWTRQLTFELTTYSPPNTPTDTYRQQYRLHFTYDQSVIRRSDPELQLCMVACRDLA